METKIEVAVIERKPNDDLPRYIDNDECSHLVRVNPNKSYLLFDDDARRGFVPDNSEYYPKIYEVSSLSTEDKRKIEGHIKSLKK